MKTVTTEDIVNEICKVCSKALDGTDIFGIFEGKVREIDDKLHEENINGIEQTKLMFEQMLRGLYINQF